MLIDSIGDTVVMFAIAFLLAVVLVGLLAVVAGADSRIDEVARRRVNR